MLGSGLISLFLCGCGGGDSTSPGAKPYDVTVPGLGVLQGALTPIYSSVAYWSGIPYAKPPIGPLRWQPPQPHEPWESPRDATRFGSSCYQGQESGSEDCLFLNIAAPAVALTAEMPLPVMVWIHGGDYQVGNGASYIAGALVNGSDLPVVVVTLNYRLNAFGFLGSSDIQDSTFDGSAGNFGIQDQQLAMAWVKEHIAAFGGDGDRITIFGESAGGNSVINHLAQNASFPLFIKAIIQSGTYDKGAIPLAEAETAYQILLNETNCRSLSCLRDLDAVTLFAKCNMCGRGPVVDGAWLMDAPTDIIAEGKHHKVPVLMGANRDENMSPWFFPYANDMNESMFDIAFVDAGGNPGDLEPAKQLYVNSSYPYPDDLGPYSQWTWALGRMLTDQVPGLGHCGVRWLAQSLLVAGTPELYAYSFDHPTQKFSGVPGTGPGSVIVPHAAEIDYVFGIFWKLTPGEEVDLAVAMSAYWVAFASAGDPNSRDPNSQELPAWPRYTAQDDIIMRLDAGEGGIRMQQHVRKNACDFWDSKNNERLEQLSAIQFSEMLV